MNRIKKTIMVLLLTLSTGIFSQNKKIKSNKEIVKEFLTGFNKSSQLQQSLNLLSENYKFKNPIVKLNSKEEFEQLATKINAIVHNIQVLNIAENNNWVAVSYNFETSIPGLEDNLATEWFKLKDGIIVESQLIYDTIKWRELYTKNTK